VAYYIVRRQAPSLSSSRFSETFASQRERERERLDGYSFCLMGFIFLFLFLWERETLHFQKNIRRNQQTEEEPLFFSPEKPWPVVFHPSGTAANRPRESDQPDKKNKKESKQPRKKPWTTFLCIYQRERRGVVG
jgi:hypothetical protein